MSSYFGHGWIRLGSAHRPSRSTPEKPKRSDLWNRTLIRRQAVRRRHIAGRSQEGSFR